METNNNQVPDQKGSGGFSDAEKQAFLDTNQLKIKPFEDWVKENEVTGTTKSISFIIFVVIAYFTLNYISDNGYDFIAAIGIILGFVFLAPIFKKKDLSKKAYHLYVNEIRTKDSDTKIRRKKIEKNVNQLEISRLKSIEVKKQAYFMKIDLIESNFKLLESIDLFKVGAFKSNIAEYENQITSKANGDALQKFVRVSKFISNIETHIVSMRESMILELQSVNIRNRVLFELEKSPRQLEKERKLIEENQFALLVDSLQHSDKFMKYMVDDSNHYKSELERVDKILDKLINYSKKSIVSFEREVEQLRYLETMANSMLVFLIEEKKVLYFEILEFFDGLGALDSSWEKKMQSGIQGIRGSLEKLSESMTGLENSINRMTSQNDLILNELASIDSSIKFGNLIQTITAYNTYRMRKEIGK